MNLYNSIFLGYIPRTKYKAKIHAHVFRSVFLMKLCIGPMFSFITYFFNDTDAHYCLLLTYTHPQHTFPYLTYRFIH